MDLRARQNGFIVPFDLNTPKWERGSSRERTRWFFEVLVIGVYTGCLRPLIPGFFLAILGRMKSETARSNRELTPKNPKFMAKKPPPALPWGFKGVVTVKVRVASKILESTHPSQKGRKISPRIGAKKSKIGPPFFEILTPENGGQGSPPQTSISLYEAQRKDVCLGNRPPGI